MVDLNNTRDIEGFELVGNLLDELSNFVCGVRVRLWNLEVIVLAELVEKACIEATCRDGLHFAYSSDSELLAPRAI
ncbi:hypothetical protein C474_14394 [Halogeometricum pallidum JCM 14848]|uniref:Uncharacterized protein n=1 Tax=Halogeometricum pallidum JCM 14848 TaxID=1227487 RepID=M0D1F1_HALPD|nr:hypothetical protein C474_14394 [Halogeometricum pallidum JCM 14848]